MEELKAIFKDACSDVYGGNALNNFERFNVKHECRIIDNQVCSNSHGYTCVDIVTITDKVTQQSLTASVDLLFVPHNTDTGYSINNSNKQIVALYQPSPGWYITKEKQKKSDSDELDDVVVATYRVKASRVGKPLTITFSKNNIMVSRGSAATKITLDTFLRAVTGYSSQEIINKIGSTNNALLRAYSARVSETEHLSMADCVASTIKLLHPNSSAEEKTENIYRLNSLVGPESRMFKANKVNRNRLKSLISFKSRALNKTLARSINFKHSVNGKVETVNIHKGTILTESVLDSLDNTTVDTLFVEYLDNTFELKKYPIAKDSRGNDIFSPEEIFTIANMAINHLIGYPLEQDEFDVTNRVVEYLDGIVKDYISERLDTLNYKINEAFNNLKSENYPDNFSLVDLTSSLTKFDISSLIEMLRDVQSKEVQTSDLDNIYAFESKNDKLMVKASNGGDDMTKTQDMQFGRLDPFDQPESQKIGMVHIKTQLAKYDEYGQITAPYIPVKNGVPVDGDPVYITADEETGKYIAEWNETFENDKVKARYNGTIVTVPKTRIDYMQYSPIQDMSLARSFVVFQNHNNAKRLQMSCNHLKQSEILNWGERPRVSTGCFSLNKLGVLTAEMLLEEYYKGRGLTVDKKSFCANELKIINVEVKGKMRKVTFEVVGTDYKFDKTLAYILPTSSKSVYMYRINTNNGKNTYKGSEIVFYNSAMNITPCKKFIRANYGKQKIEDPEFTSAEGHGINLRVLYKTQDSSTVDDAIIISSAVVSSGMGTSPVISHLDYELKSGDDKFIESFQVGTQCNIDYIDENGLPKIGTYLKHGDVYLAVNRQKIVSSKINKNEVEYQQADLALKRIENYVEGTVVLAQIHDDKATILLAHNAELEVGDKWSGRHGNKGVTSKIVPEDEMPYDEEGRPYHIILNPLGIPSRMNIGQVLEVQLSAAMAASGQYAVISPYFPNDLQVVKDACKEYGVKPVRPYDGKTGLQFDREVLEGEIYMQKLVHRVTKKITARGLGGKKQEVTLQPIKGKGVGGQSIGEMETWILHNTGCHTFLQELMSVQSDDIKSKDILIKQIIPNGALNVDLPEIENRNDRTLQVLARMMGTELHYNKGVAQLVPLTDEIISSFSKAIEIRGIKDLQNSHTFGKLYDSAASEFAILDAKEKWYHLNLNCRIIHPMWLYQTSPLYKLILVMDGLDNKENATLKTLSKLRCDELIARKIYIHPYNDKYYGLTNDPNKSGALTGMEAVCKLVENIDMELALKYHKPSDGYDTKSLSDKLKIKETYQLIDNMRHSFNPNDYIISKFPIIPRPWRPEPIRDNATNDFDKRYQSIANSANALKDGYITDKVDQLYQEIVGLLGISEPTQGRTDLQTVLKYFVDKDVSKSGGGASADHGALRSEMLSKRIDMSARTVIIPQRDMNRKPTELGVPLYVICKIWALHLKPKVDELIGNGNKLDANKILSLFSIQDKYTIDRLLKPGAYDNFINYVDEFLKTQVVVCGRQPSLHNSSIRAYMPYRSDTKCIEIHPLVCSAYNADFDGDQMWIAAPISEKAQQEVWEKLSVYTGIISPKDGACLLDHSQDSLLGLYYSTMLHQNVTSVITNPRYFVDGIISENSENLLYKIYDSVDAINLDIANNELYYQDLVLYTHPSGRKYFSTAGRIALNDLLPNAFTERPFTNTLQLPLDQKEIDGLCELEYDKLFRKSSDGKPMADQSIKKLNIFLFENFTPEETVNYYHNLMVFGLKAAHRSSISLPLSDIETYKYSQDYFDHAKILEDEINRDYELGMITEQEKKKSLISLYKALSKVIEEQVILAFPRNNNLFIIFDSGARGSKGQIVQTIGMIGITAKTTSEELETPISTSYSEGLSCFDTLMSSFSGRTAVKSTQKDTEKSGYATRQATFMTLGYDVTEYDCGKEIRELELMYEEPYKLLMHNSNGEETLNVDIDSNIAVIDALQGKAFEFTDEQRVRYAAFIIGNNRLTNNGLKLLLKDKVKSIVLQDGSKVTIKYKMDAMMKDLLVNREVAPNSGLPYTERAYIFTKKTQEYVNEQINNGTLDICSHLADLVPGRRVYGDDINELAYLDEIDYITPKTVKYLEEKNIEKVRVRILLDCQSETGCCARCYGLKFENNQLPAKFEDVGVVAAQSVGEPSTQLTMNMAHTGASMADGVAFFTGLLESNNTMFGLDSKVTAVLSEVEGYASITNQGKKSIVNIHEKFVSRRLARKTKPLYTYSIDTRDLNIIDGEYIKIGDNLNKGLISPIKYGSTSKGEIILPIKELILKRMLITVKLYFDVFYANKLDIHARHFEIFAKLQNQYVNALYEDVDGEPHFCDMTYADILKKSDNELAGYAFYHTLAPQQDVILKNGGPLTLVCFEQLCRTLSKLSFKKYKGVERGMAGKLAIGQDLADPENNKVLVTKPKYGIGPLIQETFEKIELNEDVIIEDLIQDEQELQDNNKALEIDEMGLMDIFNDLDLDMNANQEDLGVESPKPMNEDFENIHRKPSTLTHLYTNENDNSDDDLDDNDNLQDSPNNGLGMLNSF